ncbi:hypothetical protein CDD81_6666 [Ophiocordyceps australis]|uniref:Intradiol ring-cleavage dioxygenases domain-containing protein n=1 Tax=Ophiocordyceps australis TaxID=1399860 RepID=A0A2C5Y748_9HYPO|nr:hypothetical protein CDD81_6666 [Ophiocordyceps australis]
MTPAKPQSRSGRAASSLISQLLYLVALILQELSRLALRAMHKTSGVNSSEPAVKAEISDSDFTAQVVASLGPKTDERLRCVMTALMRHAHDLVREVQVTTDELFAAVDMVNWAGRMSNDRRNETQLLCDVLGIESLVDAVTWAQSDGGGGTTPSAVLGPFWRSDAPLRANGSSISFNPRADAQPVFVHGKIMGEGGLGLADATVDVWQASTNGLYEQQDAHQVEHNLRGIFKTDDEGNYSLYCIRPTPYPVPDDGPAGKLLQLLDRNKLRPAHIHFMVRARGYKTLVTQVFDQECSHLGNDSVFAVKNDLALRFKERRGDAQAGLELEFDVKLAKE